MRPQSELLTLPLMQKCTCDFLHSAVFRQGGRMALPVDGIKFHRGNFAAIGKQIQPLLEAGQCLRLQVKPW